MSSTLWERVFWKRVSVHKNNVAFERFYGMMNFHVKTRVNNILDFWEGFFENWFSGITNYKLQIWRARL